MLFTLPGRHTCQDLFAALRPIVHFLTKRNIDGLGACHISYTIRTNDLVSRRHFTRPPVGHDSLPDLLESLLDRLNADGIDEIFDLALATHPLRRGVSQVTEIIFDERKDGRARIAADRFSVQFRDHPDAGQVSLLDQLMCQSVGTA